jgi:acyl-CoA hydrolase
MSLMDKAAYACASRHAANYCVTVAVDSVDFLQPVDVGDLVSFKASVNYVGKTSLIVGIRVVSEHVQTGEKKHTNTSYITMVAKDENGETATVPALILETEEDIRRFVTAAVRKKLKTQVRERMAAYREEFTIDDEARKVLSEERCVVALRSG